MEHAPQTLSDTGRRGTVRFPHALKAQVVDSEVCSRTCSDNNQKGLMILIQLVIYVSKRSCMYVCMYVHMYRMYMYASMYVCMHTYTVTLGQYCFNYITKMHSFMVGEWTAS